MGVLLFIPAFFVFAEDVESTVVTPLPGTVTLPSGPASASNPASGQTVPVNNVPGSGPSSPIPQAPINFQIPNPFGPQSFTLFDFVKRIVKLATQIAVPIIVLMVIYCGFLFVKAQGVPEALTDARRALGYTLLGAGVILGANVIALAIEATVKSLIL